MAQVRISAGLPEEAKPLAGRRIVVTRARAQASEFTRAMEALGGEVVQFPAIEIVPPSTYGALDRAIRRIDTYHWIIFTSVNGVKHFWKRFLRLGKNAGDLRGIRIGAIGPRTAKEVESVGLIAVVPRQYRAEAILEMLGPDGVRAKRILLPRAAQARDVLPRTLERWGAKVEVVEAYRTVAAHEDAGRLRSLLLQKKIDVVTFTSSSTVSYFSGLFSAEELEKLLSRCMVACIGPITQKTAEGMGIRVDVVAGEFTIPGLTRAIVEYFRSKKGIRD